MNKLRVADLVLTSTTMFTAYYLYEHSKRQARYHDMQAVDQEEKKAVKTVVSMQDHIVLLGAEKQNQSKISPTTSDSDANNNAKKPSV